MKTLKKIFSLFAVSVIALLLYSCTEDPVTPEAEFDEARFKWRQMDVYYEGFSGVWASDTNRIYLLNAYNYSLYIVSGGNTTMHNFGNYLVNDIKGISDNEIYIFGTNFIDGRQTIIKWNGSGFEYYPTDVIITGSNFYNVKGSAVSSNEIWICSQNGISRFDGVNVTNYVNADSLAYVKSIFSTHDNRIQYITLKFFITHETQESLFEFRDTGFVRIYDHIEYAFNGFIYLEELHGNKFGLELKRNLPVCFKNFVDSVFTPNFCFNPKIVTIWQGNPYYSGIGLHEFMMIVEASPEVFDYRVGLIHWNGKRVSKEIKLLAAGNPEPYRRFILHNIDESSYLLLCPYSENTGNNTLYIGKK